MIGAFVIVVGASVPSLACEVDLPGGLRPPPTSFDWTATRGEAVVATATLRELDEGCVVHVNDASGAQRLRVRRDRPWGALRAQRIELWAPDPGTGEALPAHVGSVEVDGVFAEVTSFDGTTTKSLVGWSTCVVNHPWAFQAWCIAAEEALRQEGVSTSFQAFSLDGAGGATRGSAHWVGRDDEGHHRIQVQMGERSAEVRLRADGAWLEVQCGDLRWRCTQGVPTSPDITVTPGESVVLRRADGSSLDGTWCCPAGATACAVWHSGSGRQGRWGDGEHGPRGAWLRSIADACVHAGVAWLSLDEDGSPGRWRAFDDRGDLELALAWMAQRFDGPRLVLAHSSGVFDVASVVHDVDGVVLIAPPSRGLPVVLVEQTISVLRAQQAPEPIIERARVAAERASAWLRSGDAGPPPEDVRLWLGPDSVRWWRQRSSPPSVTGWGVPVLVLQGGADRKVGLHHGAQVAELLGSEPHVEYTPFARLDHALVRNPRGDPRRELEPDRVVDPVALDVLSSWLSSHVQE